MRQLVKNENSNSIWLSEAEEGRVLQEALYFYKDLNQYLDLSVS